MPDGRTVAVTVDDRVVRVWDLATSAPVGDPLTDRVTAVATAVLPDGRTVAVTVDDRVVRVWDLTPAPRSEILWLATPAIYR